MANVQLLLVINKEFEKRSITWQFWKFAVDGERCREHDGSVYNSITRINLNVCNLAEYFLAVQRMTLAENEKLFQTSAVIYKSFPCNI